MQIHNTNKTELKSTVILPDLFKGFVVNVPRKNKHYEIVKPISEKWLAEYVNCRCPCAIITRYQQMPFLSSDEEEG